MAASETWNNPGQCPFCGDELSSPGEGFMTHIDDSPDCNTDFDVWRERISGDIQGGWSG